MNTLNFKAHSLKYIYIKFQDTLSVTLYLCCVLGDVLQGTVFVRIQLSCRSPVETPYYSSVHVVHKDICCYCGDKGGIQDPASLMTHRVVLPMCATCSGAGRATIKRLPRKKLNVVKHHE